MYTKQFIGLTQSADATLPSVTAPFLVRQDKGFCPNHLLIKKRLFVADVILSNSGQTKT